MLKRKNNKYKMADYNRMKIKDLRKIGKEMGLLRVDKNNKKTLIERLKKG